MIKATNICKKFGNKIAVNKISLDVKSGQIFGLLGPNAAGKTTIIRMLCGILLADSGKITINNKNINQAKSEFGYVAQHFGQYEELTVWENLAFYAQMYGVNNNEKLEKLLERYQLLQFKNHRASALSGGFQRRLALVCALAHNPKVLFLDEPTAGIDPVTRKLLWDDFYRLATEGKTLFITTHYMEEAQRCHKLAFISHGCLVATGSPSSISKALGDVSVYAVTISFNPSLQKGLKKVPGVILLNQFGDELRIVVEAKVIQDLLQKCINEYSSPSDLEHGHLELRKTQLNLEDVFIALTQREST